MSNPPNTVNVIVSIGQGFKSNHVGPIPTTGKCYSKI